MIKESKIINNMNKEGKVQSLIESYLPDDSNEDSESLSSWEMLNESGSEDESDEENFLELSDTKINKQPEKRNDKQDINNNKEEKSNEKSKKVKAQNELPVSEQSTLSHELLSPKSKMKDISEFVRKSPQLKDKIKLNIGGKQKRTKEDILNDISVALAKDDSKKEKKDKTLRKRTSASNVEVIKSRDEEKLPQRVASSPLVETKAQKKKPATRRPKKSTVPRNSPSYTLLIGISLAVVLLAVFVIYANTSHFEKWRDSMNAKYSPWGSPSGSSYAYERLSNFGKGLFDYMERRRK